MYVLRACCSCAVGSMYCYFYNIERESYSVRKHNAHVCTYMYHYHTHAHSLSLSISLHTGCEIDELMQLTSYHLWMDGWLPPTVKKGRCDLSTHWHCSLFNCECIGCRPHYLFTCVPMTDRVDSSLATVLLIRRDHCHRLKLCFTPHVCTLLRCIV